MSSLSVPFLIGIVVLLVFISGFFSASEIGMMSLNRYRLRHQAKKGVKAAIRVEGLLADPDRLLGVILIGNTLANIVASSIATLIGQRLSGDTGVAIATGILTFIVLVFAEMAPKGLAARYPEKVAYPASLGLLILLKTFGPLVTFFSVISTFLLRLLCVNVKKTAKTNLTHEELITVVNESGSLISGRYKSMLKRILDLGALTVEDIMVPKSEIVGINLDNDLSDLEEQLSLSMHTRLPIYKGSINDLEGTVHIKMLSQRLIEEDFDVAHLTDNVEAPHFIVEGTSLFEVLSDFQRNKRSMGFVVDEYGDILGLLTLNDLLEEIVGEFTTRVVPVDRDLIQARAGYLLVDGGVSLRELQKVLDFQLPETEAKTLNGLITEILGAIPPINSSLKISDRPIEILKVQNNRVKMVKIYTA